MTASQRTAEEAKELMPYEKVYVLTAELPNLASPALADWEVLATVDGKAIPTKQRYSLQPLRLSCMSAAANPYLVQCNSFEGQHVVLKGASPATARELLRPTFRNWFRPRYPYVYATFRPVRID